MTVRDKMSGMIISGNESPSKRNKAVKEGDLKRQVQKLIKRLVFLQVSESSELILILLFIITSLLTATQVLDELPRRRFMTIRIFYTDGKNLSTIKRKFSSVFDF